MNWREEDYTTFWAAMTDIYGVQWKNKNGDTVGLMWRNKLAQYPVERIMAAVAICQDAGDEYPINQSVFFSRVRQVKLSAAHEDYKALPQPNKQAQEQNKRRAEEMAVRLRGKNKIGARSVFLPGENLQQYREAKAKAMTTGKTAAEFEWERLQANGWSPLQEVSLHKSAASVGCVLYPPGTVNLIANLPKGDDSAA